jgi:hypothetical protein
MVMDRIVGYAAFGLRGSAAPTFVIVGLETVEIVPLAATP